MLGSRCVPALSQCDTTRNNPKYRNGDLKESDKNAKAIPKTLEHVIGFRDPDAGRKTGELNTKPGWLSPSSVTGPAETNLRLFHPDDHKASCCSAMFAKFKNILGNAGCPHRHSFAEWRLHRPQNQVAQIGRILGGAVAWYLPSRVEADLRNSVLEEEAGTVVRRAHMIQQTRNGLVLFGDFLVAIFLAQHGLVILPVRQLQHFCDQTLIVAPYLCISPVRSWKKCFLRADYHGDVGSVKEPRIPFRRVDVFCRRHPLPSCTPHVTDESLQPELVWFCNVFNQCSMLSVAKIEFYIEAFPLCKLKKFRTLIESSA